MYNYQSLKSSVEKDSPIMQIAINWSVSDLITDINEVPYNIEMGKSIIDIKSTPDGNYSLILVGRDFYNNYYCKNINIKYISTSYIQFSVISNKNIGHNDMLDSSDKHFKVAEGYRQGNLYYIIINAEGVFLIIDYTKLSENIYNIWGFNNIFPREFEQVYTTLTCRDDTSSGQVPVHKRGTIDIPLTTGTVIKSLDENTIIFFKSNDGIKMTYRTNDISMDSQFNKKQNIKSINGVPIDTPIVDVRLNINKHPNSKDYSDIIPDKPVFANLFGIDDAIINKIDSDSSEQGNV